MQDLDRPYRGRRLTWQQFYELRPDRKPANDNSPGWRAWESFPRPATRLAQNFDDDFGRSGTNHVDRVCRSPGQIDDALADIRPAVINSDDD